MTKRIALIGGGNITYSRHLPAAKKLSLDIRLIIGPNETKSKWKGQVVRSEVKDDESLSQEVWDSFDAAVVGVPPQEHYRVASALLRRNKSILLEKPMTTEPETSIALKNMAEELGLTLAIMHNFQFSRGWQRLLADVHTREIKSVEMVQNSTMTRRIPTWIDQTPGGLFADESPHFFYLLDTLGIKANASQVVTFNSEFSETPSAICAVFDHRTIPILLKFNFASAISEWFFTVHTDEFLHVYDLFRDTYLRIPHDRSHAPQNVLRNSVSAFKGHFVGYLENGPRYLSGNLRYGVDEAMSHFVSAIQGDSVIPAGMSASSAISVVDQIARIRRLGDF